MSDRPKAYHIRAWGHESAPDLDYESDVNDTEWLTRHYPCISVALQIPVRASDILNALKEHYQP